MKILMSAYACEPGRGSEPGAGWAWARAAAQDHEVWVLTHETNRAPVAAALVADPELAQRLHPVFIGNARWARPLRRRGPTRFLYYVIWQLTVCRRTARSLNDTEGFDVAHHVTYASDWLPAGVSRVAGVPFVWGPVGGASTTGGPRLWALLGVRAFVSESVRAALLTAARETIGRFTARRAALMLAQNNDVARIFARSATVIVEPNIALHNADGATERPRNSRTTPVAVFAGRLLAWKGLRLVLAALRRPETAAWRVDVYGHGRERQALERLADRWGLSDRVRFLGARPRSEVQAALAEADLTIFPSIHDAAGWSVAEAISVGCPVVALGLGGPAALVGREDGVLVDPSGPGVVSELARALHGARHLQPRALHRWSQDRLPLLCSGLYKRVTDATEIRALPELDQGGRTDRWRP